MTDQPAPVRVLICEDQAWVCPGYVTVFSAQPNLEVVGRPQTATRL